MRKKSKRILAAALSAILIWNTCEWQPQALAASSLQRIGAETEADDTAETAEKEATLKKSALKASPSNAEAKDNRGESGTNKAEAESGANKAESGADADTGKAEAGADAGADKAEAGANEAPNGTATGAEIKTEIEAFLELDEAIAVQKFSLGAKESDIILPDTLEVEVEGADEILAEDSQNVHLVEAANKGTEKDTEAETAVWQISGITWKLNEEQSDLPEFHGGISEKDYFEEFDENGEPVETSTKTWAGYAEANPEYNRRVYVYTPILPEDLGKFEVADTADLPEIDVMVGDASVALLADGPYDLNENYLVIDKNNKAQFDGKTITGSYCPSTRPSDFLNIKGDITIHNVTVDLTIKDVTIKSGGAGARGWDLAGIYLKGNARMTKGTFELQCRGLADLGKQGEVGLDLDVYSFVTDRVRDVKTLSGGESFLAALAMALGMADVIQNAAGSVKVDAMFIDEGFGSLDEESRTRAVQVLQELFGGRRLIGIISHVTELKEEMGHKLVVKKGNGGSQVHWEIED